MGSSAREISVLPLLKDLQSSTINALVERGRRSSFAHKGMILSREDLSSRLYLLLEGKMKMMRPTIGDEESLQQRLTSGDIFCSAALASGRGCCSYAESLSQVQLLSWPHRQLRQLMQNDPQLHSNLIQLLANQIEEERSKRCLAQCVNIRAKVATHLLTMMNKHTRLAASATPQIDLRPISLTAQELGMARETMSRTLSKFEQAATITCQRGLISIQDAQQLQTIAAGLDCRCCQQHIHL